MKIFKNQELIYISFHPIQKIFKLDEIHKRVPNIFCKVSLAYLPNNKPLDRWAYVWVDIWANSQWNTCFIEFSLSMEINRTVSIMKRFQDPVEHLWWNLVERIVTAWKSLMFFIEYMFLKNSHNHRKRLQKSHAFTKLVQPCPQSNFNFFCCLSRLSLIVKRCSGNEVEICRHFFKTRPFGFCF